MAVSALIENKYNEADQALKQDELDRAAQLFQELAKSEPNEPLFHWRLGYVLSELDKLPEAILEFQEALKLDPDNVAALGGLGRVYIEKKEWLLAERAIKRRLELKESPQHYVFLAYIALQTDQLQLAAASCLKAIKLDANFSEAYFNLGLAYRYMRRLGRAITAFEKTVELDSQFSDGFRELGLSYFGAGRLGQAKMALERCIHLDPNDAWAHFYLALCSEQESDLETAAVHIRVAWRNAPDEPLILQKYKALMRQTNVPTKRNPASDIQRTLTSVSEPDLIYLLQKTKSGREILGLYFPGHHSCYAARLSSRSAVA